MFVWFIKIINNNTLRAAKDGYNEKFMKCPGGGSLCFAWRRISWLLHSNVVCFPAALTTWLIISLIALDLWQIVVLLIENPPPPPPPPPFGGHGGYWLVSGGVENLFIFD